MGFMIEIIDIYSAPSNVSCFGSDESSSRDVGQDLTGTFERKSELKTSESEYILSEVLEREGGGRRGRTRETSVNIFGPLTLSSDSSGSRK